MQEALPAIDVAILTALPVEEQAVVTALRNCVVHTWRGHRLHIGETASGPVLVFPLGIMGNVGAAQVAEQVLGAWRPAWLMLVGIAGGVRGSGDDLALGDVVVPDQVVGYELASLTLDGVHPRWQVYRPAPELLDRACSLRPGDWTPNISAVRPILDVDGPRPRAHVGPVLTGGKVVADDTTMRNLRSVWTTAVGVEMESLGVALVAYRNRSDFLMVKGVSDYADSAKGSRWHEYASAAAAAFAIAVLGGPVSAETGAAMRCPYRGLGQFTKDDAALFYGREEVLGQLVDRVREQENVLAVLGPSGSGKSSLVQAGLIAALEAGVLPRSDTWRCMFTRPTADPYGQLVEAGLAGASAGLLHAIRTWQARRPQYERLILIFDQFEDILLSDVDDDVRRRFLADVHDVAVNADACTVVLVLRDDFYAQLAAASAPLMDVLTPRLMNVRARLVRTEVRDMVQRPAAAVGLPIEDGLVDLIEQQIFTPDATEASISVLPLLQSCLTELWHRRDRGRLTRKALSDLGGVPGGLEGRCDRFFTALAREERETVRRVMTALVQPGDEAAGLAPARRRRELPYLVATCAPDEGAYDGYQVRSVIDRLVTERFATASRQVLDAQKAFGGRASEPPVIELIHDTLIRGWSKLRTWVEEDHDFRRWESTTEKLATEWKATPDDGHLLRSGPLETARSWASRRRLTGNVAEFLRASEKAVADERARWRRVQLWRRTALVTAVILAMVSTGLFIRAQRLTDRVQAAAQEALVASLAEQARSSLEESPEVAQLLASSALQRRSTDQTLGAAAAALQAPMHESATLYGHGGAVNAAAYSSDGRLLATGGDDATIRLWDVATRVSHADPLVGHAGPVTAIALRPTTTQLASGSADGTLRWWDSATDAALGEPEFAHTGSRPGPVADMVFSPDGRLLATASYGTVRLWDAQTHKSLGDPLQAGSASSDVNALAFSADGRTMAAATEAGVIREWTVPDGEPLRDLKAGANGSSTVAFSPTGELAAGSTDGTVRLWTKTGRQRGVLTGHRGLVTGTTFTFTGDLLATAGLDGAVRFWDVRTKRLVGRPSIGHTGEVLALASDGAADQIATAGRDGSVRLWSAYATPGMQQPVSGHLGAVSEVAFSPDGHTVASAGKDRSVRLWDYRAQRVLSLPGDDRSPAQSLEFDTSGGTLSAAHPGAPIVRWNVDALTGLSTAGPAVPSAKGGTFALGAGRVIGVAFDKGQETSRGQCRLAASGAADASLPLSDCTALALSRDGRRLVVTGSVGAKGVTEVFDAQNGSPVGAPMPGATDAQFDPSGDRLTLLDPSGEISEFDTWTGRRTAGLAQGCAARGATAMARAAEGDAVAVGLADGSIVVCLAATGRVIATLTGQGLVETSRADPGGNSQPPFSVGARIMTSIRQPVDRFTHVLAVSSNGGYVLTASSTNPGEGGSKLTLALWDMKRRTSIPLLADAIPQECAYPPHLCHSAVSDDGRKFAVLKPPGSLIYADVGDKAKTADLSGQRPTAISFTPDGKNLVIGSETALRRWNLSDAAFDGPAQGEGSRSRITAILVFPGGDTVITGRADGVVELWMAAGEQSRPTTLGRQLGPVTDFAFEQGGTTFLSSGPSGVYRWTDPRHWPQALCKRGGRDLTPEEWRQRVGPSQQVTPVCRFATRSSEDGDPK